MARPVRIWAAGMAVAEPGARIAATDAAAGNRCLDPSEALVGDLLAEADGRSGAALQRVGRLVEQLDRPAPQTAQLDHLRHKLVREAMRFDAKAGGLLDQFGNGGQRLRAELA